MQLPRRRLHCSLLAGSRRGGCSHVSQPTSIPLHTTNTHKHNNYTLTLALNSTRWIPVSKVLAAAAYSAVGNKSIISGPDWSNTGMKPDGLAYWLQGVSQYLNMVSEWILYIAPHA